jgi:hypothetical protein
MLWRLSHRADQMARELADRHYSRQKIGSPQFAPAGSCRVLYAQTPTGNAYWITSWPFAEYVKHAWAGAWVCSAFRNEGAGLSSDLIRQAIAATRALYGEPPELGMITFVDEGKVRRKRDPGRCFIKAGFRKVGYTKGGLLALQLLPRDMPEAELPIGAMEDLFAA